MRSLTLAAVCAAGLAAPALAQSDLLAAYDRNGDGALSRTEFETLQKEAFARLDGNGDGRLDAAELSAAGKGRGDGGRAMSRDANGDGVVTEAEFVAAGRAFGKLDRNGDGVLFSDELARLARALSRGRG
ncbi:hypothetical protein BYZ73_11035 [Rhodovulum viride]|uniref:EF-hand domain-containing protein n=1 Tax=Rhodovulum viride TaxID=1231134 RepID=A0ABX9DFR7_9RHOB|nr:EF-hand domain-containing protein [Rhodovulum viride]RAP41206.1 hypothetical protein BYZ73_11035 [Rhodovulum viride]